MSKKYKNTCVYLNYVQHLLMLVSTVTGCISMSAFSSLLSFPIDTTSSVVGVKICAITARIKKYKPIIKKKKKHDKAVLLGKDKILLKF